MSEVNGLRIVLIMVALLFFWMPHSEAKVDIQQLIDEAKPGDTVIVPKGQYSGSFVIRKPLMITGQGILQANGQQPVLTIEETEDVQVDGLTFVTDGTAIEMKNVHHVLLENVHLKNVNAGLKVYSSSSIQVKNVHVLGREGHYSEKSNGLAFYRSKHIDVTTTIIEHVQDGIYIEEVQHIALQQNIVRNSRYGVHFMYSADGVVQNSLMEHNVTGFMVMMTKDIVMENNKLLKQQGLNGYGVVLYDVDHLMLNNNVLAQNRTAISLQNSRHIRMQHNAFQMNQTAVESVKSDVSNSVTTNTFTGNILTARSDATGVRLQGNYYDDYSGLDANDDGIGDTPYVALSSFGQWMVREPAYQYFVESPAVTVLATVDQQTNRFSQSVLSDTSPAMVSYDVLREGKQGIVAWQLLVGMIVIMISGFFWRKGVQ